jgi:hypothetical protein
MSDADAVADRQTDVAVAAVVADRMDPELARQRRGVGSGTSQQLPPAPGRGFLHHSRCTSLYFTTHYSQ